MDFDVAYSLENEQQFWAELDDIVTAHCETQQLIDHALKSFLAFTSTFTDEYLRTDYDWAKCAYKLLESPLFLKHRGYVRRRMIGRLRKETSNAKLHVAASVLLFDGRGNPKVFELMQAEGLFVRLLELIKIKRDEDRCFWEVLLDLLYEMSRMQRLSTDNLEAIDDEFLTYLFKIVEEDPDDPNDPYHYPVIRVLLVMNEQYMVLAHAPLQGSNAPDNITNKVIKILCRDGSTYKTFGENIILLINRESETCLQLLILKLLYLLFTTNATCEYFYSNDLRVLVDVIIRNLLDLPEEMKSLRHTYLRVLYPLLSHTQLRHYKRDELLNLFESLSGVRSNHFAPVDQTTLRLVSRCATVPWLKSETGERAWGENPAQKMLGMSLAHQGGSSMSVVEVAAQQEMPGVITPSKGMAMELGKGNGGGDLRVMTGV
ncbi:pre-rRNA processing [Rhizina undulata]